MDLHVPEHRVGLATRGGEARIPGSFNSLVIPGLPWTSDQALIRVRAFTLIINSIHVNQ